MIQDRMIALGWRVGGFAFAFIGLLDQLDVFSREPRPSLFVYYTIQTNVLVVVALGALAVMTIRGMLQDGRYGSASYLSRLEMVFSINVLLTVFVYWILLAPMPVEGHRIWTFQNLAVHLISPMLLIIDYAVFTTSRHLRYTDVFAVLIYPYLYMMATSIAGLLGYVYAIGRDGNPVRFPYFFYDFDRVGLTALLYIGGLTVFFLLLSHGVYWLDQHITKSVFFPHKSNTIEEQTPR